MNNKSVKLIYTFLILQPIIDLFTSLMTRFINIPVTVGMLIRGLFLLFIVLYTISNNKKDNKKTIIYLSILCVFFLLYFITKTDIFNLSFLVTEIKYIFKYMYFPIVTVCMINIYDKLKLEKEKIFNIFIINMVVYSLLIIIPEITGTSFASYLDANKGTVGWFYSANEIGAILIALFPNMYYMMFKRNSFLKIIISFIVVILAMILLGTKTAFLGMLITEVIYLIYYILNHNKNRGYGLKISVILMIVSFAIFPNISAVKNIQRVISENNVLEEKTEDYEESIEETEEVPMIIKVASSGRDKFLIRTLSIYQNASLDDKLFGVGFVNRKEINNEKIEKLIEIDPLDIYFHYGLIGFVIYFVPLVYMIIKAIKYTIKNKFKLSYFKLTNIFTIGIITVISLMAGHIYGAPSVSIYIALSIAMLNSALKKEDTVVLKHKADKKKITILALHLNYGGVEQYISSLCKMLEDKYEIEIITTYKIVDSPVFPFSDKIKIRYLINDKPNKEELKSAVKSKNVIKIIKEITKSIKILYLKKYRNINAIRNIYSDYIITTRNFHNRLVGYYAYYDIIKIATEHNYHNYNKKYIQKVINSIHGFDYFVLVTENLQKFYKDKVKNIKCVYIPNVIDGLPNKKTNLKNNNIINVGRLEKEKAQEELIDIVKELKNEINDIKLYLIGDGSLKLQIEQKIIENNLEENIILTGFISKREIEKYMTDSKLFVMTSHTESFGLVLIEAMSYKVPCIAYDSADGAKVLLKNNNGILIKNRDKKQMINKIKGLLKNDNELKKYSEKGYDSCKEYLIDNVKEKWLKILK